MEKKVTPGPEPLAEHDRLEGDREALRAWLDGLSLDESHALAHELGKRTIERLSKEDRRAR